VDEATRQYFTWRAWNALELAARDIAIQFGHQDGGELVRKLYGHPDAARGPGARARGVPAGAARTRPARRSDPLI